MELNLTLPVPTSLNKLYVNEYQWVRGKGGKSTKKATGRRILSKDGVKSKNEIQAEARVQMRDFPEWNYEWTKEGYLYLDTTIFFSRRGSDDNNIYKLLCDALEKIAYENDSRVLVRTDKIMYSPHNPRVEVKLHPVQYIGIFDSPNQARNFENKCSSCSRYRKGSCSILKDSVKGTERPEVDVKSLTCSKHKKKK